MSISAADLKRYLLAALGCAVLSAVYEGFSHGVCSVWMIGLFLFPLLLGALPALLLRRARRVPARGVRRVWAAGVGTLATGSLMTGVFEIYGSPSPLTMWYWPAGGALLALAAAGFFLEKKQEF